MSYIKDLFYFGYKQALACLFPCIVMGTIFISSQIELPIARYDFIFITLVIVQIIMLVTKYESKRQLIPIFIFHLLGLVFEIVKVNAGSWEYPETAFFKIAEVPLFSGFMYASVASYVTQANMRLKLKYINWPQGKLLLLLGLLIYINFFTNLFLPDIRLLILMGIFLMFRDTAVLFTPNKKTYRISMIVSFLLIAVFIWFAENFSTFFEAWVYPHQAEAWTTVGFNIISSWFLLVVLVISLVNWWEEEEGKLQLTRG